MKKLVLGVLLAAGLVSNVQAVLITPSTGTLGSTRWQGDDNSNLSAAQIQAIVGGGPLTLVYDAEVPNNPGGAIESGTYNSSYNTTFSPISNDPEDALIDYISGSTITGSRVFLYVKDGNNSPAFYIFDISSWNRTDDLVLNDFWLGRGAISHVSILTGSGTSVPEGGATIAMLGLACSALAVGYRRAKK
jgi:hypothetical protein